VLLFEDEFSLSNTATLSATWAPVGEQPVIKSMQAKKERVTGFGSVNPLTGQFVASFAKTGNTQSFKKYLRKVLRVYSGKKKIIMYVDNVSFHCTRGLRGILAAHPQLELCYLSAYSPDLNPVERVW
jgi:hypothetical protein